MITPAFVHCMARYNSWQNDNLYACADGMSDAERKRDAGAFFGSIHGTLAHVLWGDMTWLKRFYPTSSAAPARPGIGGFIDVWPDWSDLRERRAVFDASIVSWADGLDADYLTGDLTWTSSDGSRTSTQPKWLLVTHFFNHQTHHRGQVHCLLTQAGRKPEDTDLMLLRTPDIPRMTEHSARKI